MAINKTTTETKNKIKANSVIALPNRPQIPAEQLKQAFVKPIVDTSNSMIQELDRIVEETNAELEQVLADISTLRPTIELEVASLTTLTEAEELAIRNKLSTLIVDDKIDGTKFDDIVLVTTDDLIRLHYSSIDYYVANTEITVIFETDCAKYMLNVPVEEYSYSTLTSTSTNIPTISTDIATDNASDIKTASPKAVKTYVDDAISTALENLLGGEY